MIGCPCISCLSAVVPNHRALCRPFSAPPSNPLVARGRRRLVLAIGPGGPRATLDLLARLARRHPVLVHRGPIRHVDRTSDHASLPCETLVHRALGAPFTHGGSERTRGPTPVGQRARTRVHMHKLRMPCLGHVSAHPSQNHTCDWTDARTLQSLEPSANMPPVHPPPPPPSCQRAARAEEGSAAVVKVAKSSSLGELPGAQGLGEGALAHRQPIAEDRGVAQNLDLVPG